LIVWETVVEIRRRPSSVIAATKSEDREEGGAIIEEVVQRGSGKYNVGIKDVGTQRSRCFTERERRSKGGQWVKLPDRSPGEG